MDGVLLKMGNYFEVMLNIFWCPRLRNKISWLVYLWVILKYATIHNHPQLSTTTHNHPQPSTTIHNHPQLPTTIHNHPETSTTTHNNPQPSTTTHNHPQPPTTTQNHPQLSTTTQKTTHNHPRFLFLSALKVIHLMLKAIIFVS